MSKRTFLALSCAALTLASTGCDVQPYCLTCGEGGVRDGSADASSDASRDGSLDASTDGATDASTDASTDGSLMDAMTDAPRGDGCLVDEICNGIDDTCDGVVDEGFDLMRDPFHCGSCDTVCTPLHSFPACNAGVCEIGSCDVGFYDLDGDISNGCEYSCSGTAVDDATCDLRDDDCDGMVDEDVDLTTDLLNCGTCGNVCRFGHASPACVASVCAITSCDAGYFDIDADPGNGCEYACTPASPATEVCNGRDDDCNGLIDDGDPGGGVACGVGTGACAPGVTECRAGAIICAGEITPTAELCNGIDDDCDGTIDNGNPEAGAACGSGVGACRRGAEQCTGGSLVCVGGTSASPEVCNGLDDDCNGTIDDGDPGGGASCGSGVGACSAGVEHCTGGALICTGTVGPSTEICNGIDDDCDGAVDEGNPGGGGSCGSDVGQCRPGVNTCTGGALSCVGQVGPAAEICNSLDDDCDGVIDNGNPGGGASCGSAVGACAAGTMSCRGGAVSCLGATLPSPETCNGIDDDCDGTIDNGFDLTRDANNCGACGTVCSFPHGVAGCSASACALLACATGWVNADGNLANGCEYSCSFRGAEVCNGLDDDCDGTIDNGLTPPSNFCNPNGVCAGTTATCGAAAGWQCNYTSPDYQAAETRCDGLDNDCNGSVDEPFPLAGTSCTNGEQGGCLRNGTYVCNAAKDGVRCTAAASGGGSAETCNGIDDDCDGTIDNGMLPGVIPTVSVPRAGGGTVDVMQFEASRPDATAGAEGSDVTHACGTGGVVPWTGVTWPEAQNACCALNASGTCDPAGAGWRLCDAPDWQTTCEGPAGTCTYGYGTSCSTSQPTTCNGHEYDCDPSVPGAQDCLDVTGSASFPECRANWGAAGSAYDLTGNVKEWTATPRGSGIYEIRGGAYTNIEAGRRCAFDFTVGASSFAFVNTGFRCCHY